MNAADIDDERLTALSLLQELTVSALDLFDPNQPIDDFLEQLATRLLACAALCIEERDGEPARIIGVAGLSRTSRAMRLAPEPSADARVDWDRVAFDYPEISPERVRRWTFPLGNATAPEVRWTLLVFFDGEPPLSPHYRGMVHRLAGYLLTSLSHREILAREKAGRALAETARERSEFLAEASHALSSSPDARFSTEAVAALVLPRFGDWCTIDVIDREGSLRRLGAAHIDPDKRAAIEQMQRFGTSLDGSEGVPLALRTGRTVFYPRIDADRMRPDAAELPPLGTRDEAQLTLAGTLGMAGYLVLPLVARGSTLGALACGSGDPPRTLDRDEIVLAEELAHRISLWLDNAQLVEELRNSVGELERTQRELVRRERLAALGELAATVAHEVRNPLGAMANSVSSLRRLLKPEGDAAILLSVLDEENSRLNRIVRDLLDFSRPSEPTLFLEPLTELLVDAWDTAQRANSEWPRAEVRWEVDPDVALVKIDARLCLMMFSNLFSNAIQSMPDGGTIVVALSRSLGNDDTQWAEVRITDAGTGMTDEVRRRLFEPFFTTRAKGTGLGLAIVRRIVESHHGEINVESTLGKGTTVTVRLPYDQSVNTVDP